MDDDKCLSEEQREVLRRWTRDAFFQVITSRIRFCEQHPELAILIDLRIKASDEEGRSYAGRFGDFPIEESQTLFADPFFASSSETQKV
jgi:hypothetical protein